MNELFGVSMDLIMYVLVTLLFVSLGSVAFVALRNRIMFKLGVRNIPRRRAQTTLIVLGLMLSTLIISAAFTTGDTVDRSITSEVYSILGSLDETIEVSASGDVSEEAFEEEEGPRQPSFEATRLEPLVASLAANQLIDFAIPAYSDITTALSQEQRLSSPQFTLVGLDPQRARGLPDLQKLNGDQVEVGDLGPGEIYINDSAAEELNADTGDRITLVTFGQSKDFTVRAVLKDRFLAGSNSFAGRREGGVLPLAAAQELFGVPGRITLIAVSNEGDTRGGLKHAAAVEDQIKSELERLRASSPDAPALAVNAVKQTGVDIAELLGNLLATFFLVFGLFSIGAGVLLIFLIFVMLAAERKSEMGMARAVGTRRGDLVQTFLSEGMAYNVLAAAVGTALGVGVAFIIGKIMAALLGEFDISISPHVTARSLIISYSLGVVLTFLTVTFSSWRVSYINIVRAIRDIPEPPPQRPQWGKHGVLVALRDLFFRPTDRNGWRRRGLITLGLVLAAFGAGATPLIAAGAVLVAIAFITFAIDQKTLSPQFRAGLAVLLIVTMPVSLVVAFFMTLQLGPLCILASIPLIVWGTSDNSAFPLLFGLSLLPLGIAMVARSFGANERLVYTATGLVLLYVWLFDFSVGLIEKVFGPAEGDIEMFFLSGVMITLAATFIVVYNSDLVLVPLTRIGGALGSLLPSLKMAVAYPLANKSRTGMTMAMFCLVVFALTMMSSMNYNFERLFLSDRSLGGWDVLVDEHPTNPIGDLRAALTAAGSDAAAQIEAVGTATRVAGRSRVCQLETSRQCRAPAPGQPGANYVSYPVWGADAAFLSTNEIALQARATGYGNDRAVWDAVARDPSLAVVDPGAFGDFGPGFLAGVDQQAKSFGGVPVTVLDRTSGQSVRVTIIGIIEFGSSNTYRGLFLSEAAFNQAFLEPDNREFFVKTRDGANNVATAREIEAALLTTGAQAESIRKQVDDASATQRGFFRLLQGFMGLGLLVGVAAVGVIAFRTVVERRQQIGMLRAMGYTRGMIGLTFLIESAFIAFIGVVSGIVFAVILARQLVTDEFANQGVTSFAVPWVQLGIIGGLAFGFALLMTLIPSRQAARIPIAAALRYE